jgi:hypothetical protein
VRAKLTLAVPFVGFAVLTGGGPATAHLAAGQAAHVRTVYFSAQDAKGVPITDLQAAEVTVKEGGKDQQIASLGPATAPMRVAILVDDAGSGIFQAPVAQLLQATLDRGQFAIRLLNPQPLKIVDYTNQVESLKGAIGRLAQRGRITVDGEQMVGAVRESAEEMLQSKAARPVIVALSVSGEALQSDSAEEALTVVRKSGAGLNVLHYGNSDLGRVLGDGPRQSGGRFERAGSVQAVAPALAKIATHLMSQYVVTYALPVGVKPNARLAIATSRKGATLVAPTLMPD